MRVPFPIPLAALLAAIQCWAFTASLPAGEFDDAISRLVDYRGLHGSAPTLDYYLGELERTDLTNSEQARLYVELVNLQQPPISLQDLLANVRTARDSIQCFTCRYKYSADPTYSVHSYTFSSNRIRVDEPLQGSAGTSRTSFDGEVERFVLLEPGKMTNARIEKLSSPTTFLRPYMPLCQAMMFNSDLIGNASAAIDLVKFLESGSYDVFEATESVGQDECLIVANLGFKLYLDIEKNFALRQLDSFNYEYGEAGEDGQAPLKRVTLGGRKVNSDFREFGDGIWLPMQMKLLNFRDGQHTETIVTVLEMEVNPQLDDSVFTDIIPDDAFVSDGIEDLAYIDGEKPSIGEAVLMSTPRNEVPMNRRVLIWINVAALILIVWILAVRFFTRTRAK